MNVIEYLFPIIPFNSITYITIKTLPSMDYATPLIMVDKHDYCMPITPIRSGIPFHDP